MAIQAKETHPGSLYRPTRRRELVGRSVLKRPTDGQRAKALRRLEKNPMRLTGQEVYLLSRLREGWVLFRLYTRFNGSTISRWIALPLHYVLRQVRR